MQYKILALIFNSDFATKFAFLGGTCLRIVHQTNRFSEDLDFDNFDVFGSIRTTPVDLLLAQKITAFCLRKQPKGRDIYDITFLCAKTRPNYAYLQQRLAVTNATDLKETLYNRLAHLDLAQLAKDVAPFLFNTSDAQRILLFPQFVQQAEF